MKKRRKSSRRKIRLIIPLIILLFGIASNWYVHQSPEWRGKVDPKLPSFVVAAIESAGNASAEYTDNLGLTGRDVAISKSTTLATTHFYGAPPQAVSTNAPAKLVTLGKTGFSLAYSPEHRHPWWVAYHIAPVASLKPPPRPTRFSVDTAVNSPKHDEYTHSGYDRGHMAPNFAIASRYGAEAQKQTFLTSNICPQSPALNQGAWRDVEHRVASIYAQRYPVWVLIGPLPPAKATDKIVDSKKGTCTGISIPSGFWHIIISEHDGRLRVLAMIFPQDTPRNAHPRKYLSSVREIEKLTGLDFFSDLPQAEQDLLELPTATRLWSTGVDGTWFILKERLKTRAKRDAW